MIPTKYIWQSRTVIVNSVIIVLAALDALQLLPAVPPGWAPYILAAQGFLNVVLRLTTSSGIAGFAPQGVPMRAAPAPQAAPPGEAGAPSDLTLAQQLEADFIARGELPAERAPGETP